MNWSFKLFRVPILDWITIQLYRPKSPHLRHFHRNSLWVMCVLKGTRFMPRTLPHTVKTNVLKKSVEVLIRKIILPLISLSSKLVTYTLIPVAIYLFRRTVSSTQCIDIVLFFQYNLRCCNVSTCWKSVSREVFFINTIPETPFNTYKRFTLPKRCVYIYNCINFL